MAEVVFRSVHKEFPGGVQAVRNFNLEVQDKEFVVLVGPSGCGKSTSLRMVAGLEEITTGEIYIGGQLVNDVPPKDRGIAMVFQNYALYPHMTVFKNMAFGLMLRKEFSKDEIRRRVEEAAAILGIQELLDRKPKALSGGQRQRVAVGRAIVRKPKVFLFDEPLSNLDAKMRVQMRIEISKLHNRLQTTMIYVTHDQLEAMTMGDRIVVMKDGDIQQVDAPIALYDNPRNMFVGGFIGTPPMNFIPGQIILENDKVKFQWGVNKVTLDQERVEPLREWINRKVMFGIRPEDLRDESMLHEVNPENRLIARVEVIEPVGSESIWYLTTGGMDTFLAKVDSHSQAEVNKDKSLIVNVKKAHVFHPDTEEAII